jgi:hypothetical protein
MRKKKTLEQFFSRARDIAKELDMSTNEPVAIRYDFDGYGYQYMDSGSGSDWQTRVEGQLLYTHTAEGEYVSHRSLAEEITEGFNALKQIRELEAENAELKATVRSFFQDFIDIREESDSGRVFAPITISSCRCMMIEPLADVLAKMRTLSGAKKRSEE